MTSTEIMTGSCAAELADDALATGRPHRCPACRTVAVPDVVIVQGVANGEEVPDTWRLRRHDGRVVYFFLTEGDQ